MDTTLYIYCQRVNPPQPVALGLRTHWIFCVCIHLKVIWGAFLYPMGLLMFLHAKFAQFHMKESLTPSPPGNQRKTNLNNNECYCVLWKQGTIKTDLKIMRFRVVLICCCWLGLCWQHTERSDESAHKLTTWHFNSQNPFQDNASCGNKSRM